MMLYTKGIFLPLTDHLPHSYDFLLCYGWLFWIFWIPEPKVNKPGGLNGSEEFPDFKIRAD